MDPIKDTQKFSISLEARDAKEQPTTLPDGATISAASSNPNVATATVNGQSVDVVAGLPGTTTISVEATADGVTAAGALDVTVTPGAEKTLTLVPGPVSEQE